MGSRRWMGDVACRPVADDSSGEVDLTMVTMTFDAVRPGTAAERAGPLRRGQPGSPRLPEHRPRDVVHGTDRFVIIQKWESPEAQRAHFDSADMVAMATACDGLLAAPPRIDLLEPISAHDLA